MSARIAKATASGRCVYVTTYFDGASPVQGTLTFRTPEDAAGFAWCLQALVGETAPPSEVPPGELPGWTWDAERREFKHPSGALVYETLIDRDNPSQPRWCWHGPTGTPHSTPDTRRDTAVQAAAYALGYDIAQYSGAASIDESWGWRKVIRGGSESITGGGCGSADAASLAALEHAERLRAGEP